MRKELQKIRKQLKIALHQLINMRKEQVAYRIILDRELGFEVDKIEVIPTIPGWTDRAYEKTYLKGELVDLVDRLQALDPRFRFDPNFFPSRLSTSRECLLTDRQMENMLVIYQNYSVFRSENQRRAAEALRNYLQMKKDYEKKLVHNNIMVDEITSVREKIRELRKQAKEDMYFMNFLVNFKLYKEIPVVQEVEETIPTPELEIIGEISMWHKIQRAILNHLTGTSVSQTGIICCFDASR
ncbi:uncharacterized protein TNCV_1157691 [Trichonephila clavipes]|nr:uncharacterized protein TNCV_1157691 [Trichonephila clavipes]